MHLARPQFRPWRILCALVSAYLASGLLYTLARAARLLFEGAYVFDARMLDPFLLGVGFLSVVFFGAITALGTLLNLGFPIVDADTNERANLYPVIVPLALAFLTFAIGAVRFGARLRPD